MRRVCSGTVTDTLRAHSQVELEKEVAYGPDTRLANTKVGRCRSTLSNPRGNHLELSA